MPREWAPQEPRLLGQIYDLLADLRDFSRITVRNVDDGQWAVVMEHLRRRESEETGNAAKGQ